jgi:8-amino-7-oxononanoate synthase
VVVTDGFSPSCGMPAPLEEYAACVGSRGGLLVVDDTQSLGIFGPPHGASSPYGRGGGGSLQKFGLQHPGVVVISSLAKAFGVPIAILGGSSGLIGEFRKHSRTRMHCSPPATPVVAAACHALEENRRVGEALRWRLTQRVLRFRRGLKPYGWLATDSLFPVQPLRMRETNGRMVYQRLLDRGIEAVLHGNSGNDAHLSLVMTARHRLTEIDKALGALLESFPAATAGEMKGRELIWRDR